MFQNPLDGLWSQLWSPVSFYAHGKGLASRGHSEVSEWEQGGRSGERGRDPRRVRSSQATPRACFKGCLIAKLFSRS